MDRNKRTVEYYDSFGDCNPKTEATLKELAKFLSKEDGSNRKDYEFKIKVTKRLQNNGYDCGIWVTHFLEKRLENPDFNLNTPLDMKNQRSKVHPNWLKWMKKTDGLGQRIGQL